MPDQLAAHWPPPIQKTPARPRRYATSTAIATPLRGERSDARPIRRRRSSRRLGLALAPVFLALTLPLVPSLPAAAAPLSATAGAAADLATAVSPVGAPWVVTSLNRTAGFTVTVTNHGPSTAANVTVTNTVGSVDPLVGITATPATVSCSVSTGTCTEPQLPSGASITITVIVHPRVFVHGQIFGDRATATSTTPDPNTANNSALGYYWCANGL